MIAEQTFNNSSYELTEWYLYANGWAMKVRTDLAGGLLDASSTVWLMRRNPHWISGDPPAFAVHGDGVPVSPWKRGEGSPDLWFTEDGESPDWMTVQGVAELGRGVALLEPRPDE